jgi:hypothetical protein
MTEVLDRVETLDLLKKDYEEDKRLVVSRYCDGEYLLMSKKGTAGNNSLAVSDLLLGSIKAKDQLVCINYLKPHNIEREDIYYKTHNFLVEHAEQELCGCSNWMLVDYQDDSDLLSKLFSGKTIVVGGLAKDFHELYSEYNKDLEFYETPSKNSNEMIEEIKNDLISLCNTNKYDNIILAFGPACKVVLVDLIPHCDSNIVDVGSMLNAFVNRTGEWPMSWTGSVDIKEKNDIFASKLKADK